MAALKGNHPLFYKEVQEYFSEEKLEEPEKMPGHYVKTIEKEHGGIVSRQYYQTEETGWYEDKDKWKGLEARGYWGVENQLHWRLDFTFKDDYNTTAEKSYAKNMQMLKKIALAILRIVQTMYS